MVVSIVIRTLNEDAHLSELFLAIRTQKTTSFEIELILVDSGSEDNTLSIAERFGCKILHIKRRDFSFGRSLNMGCNAATGQILVIISGHCIPTNDKWLENICAPIVAGHASYTYGKQVGTEDSRYSECRVFDKYYPSASQIPQDSFFCNNANAALCKSAWKVHRFDEELTGLEDMALAKQLIQNDLHIAYVAEACVYHHHDETWSEISRRYERESIALRSIMPQIQVGKRDLIRYIFTSILFDFNVALGEKVLLKKAVEIVKYRCHQYWGSYKGNHTHRELSNTEKEKYFFPNKRM